MRGRRLLAFALCLQWAAGVRAAALDPAVAGGFLDALIHDPAGAERFVDPEDLAIVRRLGITYPEAPCKALIGWDLTQEAKDALQRDGLTGAYVTEDLGGPYAALRLFPDDSLLARRWIFRDGRLVSSILYQTRDWTEIESPRFRFRISDPSAFHPANIDALEAFTDTVAARLDFDAAQRERLAREKIIYCFCRDQAEMRALTGFEARGMAILSHDLVVSTYSAHCHELAHLLINVKLGRPHLYTHPLLMEGFAVAMGGRGGRAPGLLRQLGAFLVQAGWVNVDDLLTPAGFQRENASMSYPAAALVAAALLEARGSEGFLALYAEQGGAATDLPGLAIPRSTLPAGEAWSTVLAREASRTPIHFEAGPPEQDAAYAAFRPVPDERLEFVLPALTLVAVDPVPSGLRGAFAEELLEGVGYRGERYLFRVGEDELGIYDLFLGTMIAHYARAFSITGEAVPVAGGRYRFQVDARLFPALPRAEDCRYLAK